VLVSLLILLALLSLFTLRSLDDNRFVSWLWIFNSFSTIKFALVISAGMFIAYGISRPSLSEKHNVILLFIASFLIATFFWSAPEVIIDASRYFVQAKQLELHGMGYFLKEWGDKIPAWTDLPLIPFIYGVIFRSFGECRTNIQIFNTLLFSGTTVLTYLVGKTLWNKDIGLTAGGLLLGIPYIMTQVPLMMVDIATMFTLTLAIFVTIKAVESGNTRLCVFASVAIVLAMLTKYSNWLMLSIIPVIFLVYFKLGWKVLAQKASIIALCLIPILIGLLATKSGLVFDQLQILRDFQAVALYRWQESWISTFLFQIHPVITIFALLSIYLAVVSRDAKYFIVIWLVLLVFLLDIKRIRYLVPAFPMIAIMGSYGLVAVRNFETRKFIVSGTVVSVVLICAIAYLPFLELNSNINIKRAGQYLDSINVSSTEVFVLPNTDSSINPTIAVALLDLFTEKHIVYRLGSDIESLQPFAELPWRWTWEIKNAHYRSHQNSIEEGAEAVVIIRSRRDQRASPHIEQIIEDYQLIQEFTRASGVFKYKTLVYIYRRK
jgi:hypothetical protein